MVVRRSVALALIVGSAQLARYQCTFLPLVTNAWPARDSGSTSSFIEKMLRNRMLVACHASEFPVDPATLQLKNIVSEQQSIVEQDFGEDAFFRSLGQTGPYHRVIEGGPTILQRAYNMVLSPQNNIKSEPVWNLVMEVDAESLLATEKDLFKDLIYLLLEVQKYQVASSDGYSLDSPRYSLEKFILRSLNFITKYKLVEENELREAFENPQVQNALGEHLLATFRQIPENVGLYDTLELYLFCHSNGAHIYALTPRLTNFEPALIKRFICDQLHWLTDDHDPRFREIAREFHNENVFDKLLSLSEPNDSDELGKKLIHYFEMPPKLSRTPSLDRKIFYKYHMIYFILQYLRNQPHSHFSSKYETEIKEVHLFSKFSIFRDAVKLSDLFKWYWRLPPAEPGSFSTLKQVSEGEFITGSAISLDSILVGWFNERSNKYLPLITQKKSLLKKIEVARNIPIFGNWLGTDLIKEIFIKLNMAEKEADGQHQFQLRVVQQRVDQNPEGKKKVKSSKKKAQAQDVVAYA